MYKIHKLLLTMPLAFLAGVSPQAFAGGKAEDIQRLRDLLHPISSLSAQFKQRISDADGFELQVSQGLFEVSQPNKLRWIVEQPMSQQVISDGITLWVYDPDLEQLIIQPFDKDIAATPAILFSGDLDSLDSVYFVERLEKDSFLLTPEEEGSLFRSTEIQFDGDKPSAIVLTDTLGQITLISFTGLKLNPPISADQFVFKIPQGIDIIDNAN
jgi:outer membrane lipoprotein carrier protein